ncbi:MAG: M48 family metallopeptidase [Bacteroidetes bacterium]|nr:M48 family metallopeptidase [Bacteroidota bacterium]
MLRTRVFPHVTLLLVAAVFLASCGTVPVTGRKQLNLIPASTMLSMSYQQYGDFMQSNRLSSDQSKVQMVRNVGKKIQSAVERYFAQHGLSGDLNGYQWAFNLIESNEVNAWCMPGGKVVVYTGILPVTRDEAGLAVVMGHEIAHAVAEHGNERMSQGLLTQLGGMALSEAVKEKPAETQQLWMAAFGVGAQVGVLLPYSRLHESEADRLGLIFMAMAGYNPQEAVNFWQRMSAMKSGSAPPEFLSTHPSDETRIKDLQKAMPEAMKYYRGG